MLLCLVNPGHCGSHSQDNQPNQVSFTLKEISMVLLAQTATLLPSMQIMGMVCPAPARTITALLLPSSKRDFMPLLHSQCRAAAMDINRAALSSHRARRANRRPL